MTISPASMAARMSRSDRTLIARIIARECRPRTLPAMDERRALLDRTAELANDFLDRLPTRPVARPLDLEKLRAAFGGPLPDAPQPSIDVIEELARAAEPGLVGTAGPRYFGFVVGGGVPT